MEWNVKNALNRDVERQHLNKILKEISSGQLDLRTKVDAATAGLGSVQNNLSTTITKIINNTLPPSSLTTSVTLTGDVTGVSVPVLGQNAVTINATLTGDYLEDAPVNTYAYWRRFGQWEQVPPSLDLLAQIQGQGFTVYDDVNEAWYTRSILSADESRIIITDGDGLAADPTIDLATVTPEEQGQILGLEFDEYGRRTGEREVTTDDLEEGTTNLYYTAERAQDDVAGIMEGDETIDVVYDDTTPSITIGLTPEYKDKIDLAVVSSNTPTDGDILEFNGTSGSWVAKKDPRELLIDGGNF